MSTFGRGVSELWDLKFGNHFENFAMLFLFESRFNISRILAESMNVQSEWQNGYQRSITHMKRIEKG